MSTNIFDDLRADDETLARLHQRLERDAVTDELLDVAYRTVDSPVGTLHGFYIVSGNTKLFVPMRIALCAQTCPKGVLD